MFLVGLGTAAPARRYLQRDCWAAASVSPPIQRLAPRSRALLKKVLLGDNGVEARHLVLDTALRAGSLSGCSWLASFGAGFSVHGALCWIT